MNLSYSYKIIGSVLLKTVSDFRWGTPFLKTQLWIIFYYCSSLQFGLNIVPYNIIWVSFSVFKIQKLKNSPTATGLFPFVNARCCSLTWHLTRRDIPLSWSGSRYLENALSIYLVCLAYRLINFHFYFSNTGFLCSFCFFVFFGKILSSVSIILSHSSEDSFLFYTFVWSFFSFFKRLPFLCFRFYVFCLYSSYCNCWLVLFFFLYSVSITCSSLAFFTFIIARTVCYHLSYYYLFLFLVSFIFSPIFFLSFY